MTNKNNPTSSYKLLMEFIKLNLVYKWTYILIVMLILLLSLLGIVAAEMTRRMVGSALSIDINQLFTYSCLALIIAVICFSGRILTDIIKEKFQYKSTLMLQKQVVKQILCAQIKILGSYHSGDLIQRVQDSVKQFQTNLSNHLIEFLRCFLQILALSLYLSFINIHLSIGTFIIIAIFPLVSVLFSKFIRKKYATRNEINSKSRVFLQDSFQGAESVQIYRLENKFFTRFSNIFVELLRIEKLIFLYESFINNFRTLTIILRLLFIFCYGGFLVFNTSLKTEDVIIFAIVSGQIATPLSALLNLWPQIQGSLSHIERVIEILKLPHEEVVSSEDEHPNSTSNLKLCIQNVSFSYDKSQVLNKLSFCVERGQLTVLTGHSGCGKSTILKLLTRFFEDYTGTILLDGQNIKSIPVTEWRNKVAYIAQESYLFSGSILENLVLGYPNITREEVIEAAKKANIHNFISSLPNGYETILGENGLSLSGGQKQRINLARAFLINKDIILLDEPTTALDAENERLFNESLEQLIVQKICICVTHRVATMQRAHKILYMDNGEITEIGNHHSLMEEEGRYYQLLQVTSVDMRKEIV